MKNDKENLNYHKRANSYTECDVIQYIQGTEGKVTNNCQKKIFSNHPAKIKKLL